MKKTTVFLVIKSHMWAKSFISHNKPKNSQALAHILEGKCALPFYRITPILRLEMIHFTGDIDENFEPHLLLPFCP